MMNKMMKKVTIALAVMTMAVSTASLTTMAAESVHELKVVEQDAQGANILPHWNSIYDDEGKILAGQYATDIDLSTIKDADGGFTVEVKMFKADNYHAGEIHNLKPGDKILYNGSVITVDKVENDVKDNDARVLVNGGYDNGGLTFAGGEGGSITPLGDDDRCGYEVIAEGRIFVDSKVVLNDKRDLSAPEGKTYTGTQEIKAFFENDKPHINHYNTDLFFNEGELLEINLKYTP